MERMLRIYFMQQWFNLSDPAAEDSLYDSESMRRFAGIELMEDAVPDETTILRFRHLLEQHQLTERIFGLVRGLLEQKRLLLKCGTIVDATIIEAPPSTKNEAKARDPEMHQTKKGKDWHFGMKAHVGTDLNGLVHTLVTTHAAQPRTFKQLPKLLHGQERELYGDQAYWSEFHRVGRAAARGALPRQPPAQPRAASDDAPAQPQPPALGDPGALRARLPRGEAPVGLHQGALPGSGEEHRPTVHQPSPWPTCTWSDDDCCRRRGRVDAICK